MKTTNQDISSLYKDFADLKRYNIKTRIHDFHMIISQKRKLDHEIRPQIPIFAIN
jgi:hypothetical protein